MVAVMIANVMVIMIAIMVAIEITIVYVVVKVVAGPIIVIILPWFARQPPAHGPCNAAGGGRRLL